MASKKVVARLTWRPRRARAGAFDAQSLLRRVHRPVRRRRSSRGGGGVEAAGRRSVGAAEVAETARHAAHASGRRCSAAPLRSPLRLRCGRGVLCLRVVLVVNRDRLRGARQRTARLVSLQQGGKGSRRMRAARPCGPSVPVQPLWHRAQKYDVIFAASLARRGGGGASAKGGGSGRRTPSTCASARRFRAPQRNAPQVRRAACFDGGRTTSRRRDAVARRCGDVAAPPIRRAEAAPEVQRRRREHRPRSPPIARSVERLALRARRSGRGGGLQSWAVELPGLGEPLPRRPREGLTRKMTLKIRSKRWSDPCFPREGLLNVPIFRGRDLNFKKIQTKSCLLKGGPPLYRVGPPARKQGESEFWGEPLYFLAQGARVGPAALYFLALAGLPTARERLIP